MRIEHDVYFAVNTLKEDKTKGARVHENMGWSRSLFLDLDVEPTGKGGKYKTQKAAVGALEEFCANVGLPVPTLVSSGYGVHCYWRFDTDISVSAWLHYAELLHRLIMHWNFKADPNCIKDQSRVLRIPGGLNFKNRDAPKRVVVKYEAGEVTTTDIWDILIDACEASDISTDTTQKAVGKTVGSVGAGGNLAGPEEFSGKVPEYAQLLATCAQVQFIEEHGGALERSHWHKGLLGLIRRCSDGREHCHRLSKKNYPDYDYDEVELKIGEQEMAGIGPTSCAVMAEVANNGLCKGCAFAGRTVSPINTPFVPKLLSPTELPAPAVNMAANAVFVFTPPPMPDGYQWVTTEKDKSGNKALVGVGSPKEMEDGTTRLIQFLDYVLFPISRQQNISGDGDQHIWCVHVPNEEPKTFVIPSYMLNDQRDLSKVLLGQGIYVDAPFFRQVQAYMSAYVKRLQRDNKPEQKYLHYGWVDENTGFIIGDRKIMKGGKVVPVQCSGGAAELLERFTLKRKGELALQIEAMKYFTRHNKPSEQFYILCSLASPLIHMLDNYYGCTVNAAGPTGGGKSGLMMAATSMWGNPRNCYMSGVHKEGATPKARLNGLFSMWSMPFALDEISGIEPEDARSLTYMATQARPRDKLTKGSQLQIGTGASASNDDEDFRSNLLLTNSNGSLHSRLSEGSVVGAATSARVIEIDYPILTPEEKLQGDDAIPLLYRNYGHIGELFIRYVVDNYDEVKTQVREKAKEIDKKYGVKLAERFLSSVAPCVFIASIIARKLGLLDFNEQAIIDWLMIDQLNRIRGVIEMEYVTPVAALSDFINESTANFVLVNEFQGKVLDPKVPTYKAIHGRYEKRSGKLYISSEALHTYFARKRLPRKEFLNALTEMKVVIGPARVQLAKGGEFAGGRTCCYEINMLHGEMEEASAEEHTSRLQVITNPTATGRQGLDPSSLRLVK